MKSLPAPNIMGMPSKYIAWRAHQSDAVSSILSTDTPFITQIAPTGFGKSLTYTTAAKIGTNRTFILTSTKALQRQLTDDFAEIGMVSVRGKNSYMCRAENDGSRCDEGPCNAGGFKCRYKEEGGCPYYDALKAANSAPLVVTNYAMWMTYNKYAKGFNKPDMLICDEAHDLPQIVSDFLTSKISRSNVAFWAILKEPEDWNQSVDSWADWADHQVPLVNDEISNIRKKVKEGASKAVRRRLRSFINLKKSLLLMTDMDSETWVMDINDKYIEFAPIWPKEYTNEVLFLDIDKIVLTSATVCGKTVNMLGVDDNINKIMEFPHSFPVKNRQLIHIPTVRLNIRATNLDIREWTKRIDQILRPRLDRKGIIHTVSYERRNHVMAQSRYSEHMMTHQTADAIKQVHRFKKAPPPKFLVSPSMTTGWDFPYEQCEFQIVGKLAYPDTRNKIVKARVKEDPDYGAYVAMQQLVQACGRAVRAKDDHSENFIIDDNILWFVKKYAAFAPKWFLEGYRSTRTIPTPPRRFNHGEV